MSKNFLKGWSVDQKTVERVAEAAKLLDSEENQSYALRQLVKLGLEQLEKQKASA